MSMRAEKGKNYWTIGLNSCGHFYAQGVMEKQWPIDDALHENNLYFLTKEKAESMIKTLRKSLIK